MSLCRTGHFEFCVAVDDILALVALILTAADSHFELGAAILEVELERDERAALLLLGLAHLGNFVHMGQELAAPCRKMIETVGEKVFVDSLSTTWLPGARNRAAWLSPSLPPTL